MSDVTLSRRQIAESEMPVFRGVSLADITLVDSPEKSAAARAALLAAAVIGFDTEFVGEQSFHPELCLIQVSTADSLLLIDPQSCGDLSSFWELMTSGQVEVVVHAGREEIRQCIRATGQPPKRCFDVQIAAGLLGLGAWWREAARPPLDALAGWALQYWWAMFPLALWLSLAPVVVLMYTTTNMAARLLGYDVRPFPGARAERAMAWLARQPLRLRRRRAP